MLVIAENPTYRDAERTFLTDPLSASGTTWLVKNTAGFVANNYAVLGNPGQDKTEIKKISSVDSVTQFTGAATSFAHSPDDPVYLSRFNQIKIYRASSLSGSYTLLTTVDIQIDNSNGETVYDDTSGTTSNYYKVSYYNSTSGTESALSDPIPGSGYSRTSCAYLIDDILDEANDRAEQVATRGEVLRWLGDCDEEVWGSRKKWEFFREDDTLSATADTKTVALSGLSKTFDKLDYITFNYVSGGTDITYRLREIILPEYERKTDDNNDTHDDRIQEFALDFLNNNLLLNPIPDTTQTNKLTVYYYFKPSPYDSEGDTLYIPNSRVYFTYGMMRFHMKKKSEQRIIDKWEQKFFRAQLDLVRLQRRSSSQPRSMEYKRGSSRRYYGG